MTPRHIHTWQFPSMACHGELSRPTMHVREFACLPFPAVNGDAVAQTYLYGNTRQCRREWSVSTYRKFLFFVITQAYHKLCRLDTNH